MHLNNRINKTNEFCEIVKNNVFTKHPRTIASNENCIVCRSHIQRLLIEVSLLMALVNRI